MSTSFVSIVGFNKSSCGYCHQDDTSYTFGVWAHKLSCKDYQELVDRGWRRSGKYLYKPNLRKSCCPQYAIRLDTSEFNVSKSQRKIINKFNKYIEGSWHPPHEMVDDKTKEPTKTKKKENKEPTTLIDMIHFGETNMHNEEDYKHSFRIELEPSSYTEEKFGIYCKYQKEIHHDEPEELKPKNFTRFLVDTPLHSEDKIGTKDGLKYGSYHQKYILNDTLIAVAILDFLPNCVSSVYFMYDPDYSFLGLGNYSALREISLTQELYLKSKDLKYYYMGYYIHSCIKMKYKGKYHPSYLLDPETYEWFSLDKVCTPLLDKHKYVSFADPETSTKQLDDSNKNKNDDDDDDQLNPIPPPGWLNPSSLTDKDFEEVFILAGKNMMVPVTYLEAFDDQNSTIKKDITNFVAAVGLKLAEKLIIC